MKQLTYSMASPLITRGSRGLFSAELNYHLFGFSNIEQQTIITAQSHQMIHFIVVRRIIVIPMASSANLIIQ